MNMFKNMIDPVTGEASKYIAQMVIDRVDFNTDPEKRCDKRPNMNAYTTPGTGKFHFCPHGIEKAIELGDQMRRSWFLCLRENALGIGDLSPRDNVSMLP